MFESAVNFSASKPNLCKPNDVGKLCAAVLQENDRSFEAKATLEQTKLMNDVWSWRPGALGVLVVARKDQERESAGVQHFVEPCLCRLAGHRLTVKFLRRKPQALMQKVF